ncbi:MAG: hypothetical protein HQK91_04765 [Nitrospirae bacterium]|nr:hypothetical protein [Nitrospirota bacterium]
MSDLTKLEEELHSSEYKKKIKQHSHCNTFSIVLLTILVLLCILFSLGTYFQTKENNVLINQMLFQQNELKRELNVLSSDVSMTKTQNNPQEVKK